MNIRLRLLISLSVTAATLFALWPMITARADFKKPSSLKIIASDPGRIVLDWSAGSYRLRTAPEGEVFELDGAFQSVEGWPAVGTLIGIPYGARVQTHILVDEIESIGGQHPLVGFQPRLLSGDDFSQVGSMQRQPLAVKTLSNLWAPSELVHISEPATLRYQQVVRAQLFPLQVMAAKSALRLHRHVQFELSFETTALSQNDREVTTAQPDAFEEIYQAALMNYEQARAWRLTSTSSPAGVLFNGGGSGVAGYKIAVDRDGLYRMTAGDLAAVGLPVTTINPQTFRLIYRGQEVALRVTGEADGRFDVDDFIEFYGEQRRGDEMFTKYSDENVYWLTYGGAPGTRMSEVPALRVDNTLPSASTFSQTLHFEPSNLWWTWAYVSLDTHQTDDTWYWDQLVASGNPLTGTYAITLPSVAVGNYSATLRGELAGGRINLWGTHHALVYLNGESSPIADLTWSNRTLTDFQISLEQNRLAPNGNTIRIALQADTLNPDDIYLNWLEVSYQRGFTANNDQLTFASPASAANMTLTQFSTGTLSLYDISVPTQTRHLTVATQLEGGTYFIAFQSPPTARQLLAIADTQVQKPKSIIAYQAPDLRSPTNGADYIVIAHSSLITEAQRLADHRAAQGLRVRLVDVEDLYNQFNDGLFHPVAIRNFLAYAFENWQRPAPAWVVLIGGGNWNFKGFSPSRYGPPQPNLVPPYLWFVDPWQGEADATNRFVTVAGDDLLPDLFVGRLPADTPQQVQVMIDKLIRYEAQAMQQDWQGRMLFAADNIPDVAGDFWRQSDSVADRLPAPMVADKAYLPASDANSVIATTRAITQSFNNGVLLSNYVGHGALYRWADEAIFTTDLAASLSNRATLPVNLSLTCLDGYFLYPHRVSLAQGLLWNPNGGALASWSPTGLGVATGHDVLHRGFYRAVFDNDLTRLGPATTVGKMDLFATGQNLDLIDTFTVFGDPYLSVAVWRPALQMTARIEPAMFLAAGDQLSFILSIRNVGRRVASGMAISMTLPSELDNLQLQSSSQPITSTTANTWNLSALNAGTSASVTFKVTVNSNAPATGPITMTAHLSSAVAESAPAGHKVSAIAYLGRATDVLYLPLVRGP